jgi:ChrB-like protein
MVTQGPRQWLLLLYRVPPEPTANRVSIWRKLKRLGAILLHDSVWVLPPSPRTTEELRWLAAEIRERSGDAMLWEASLGLDGHDDDLVRQFVAQVDNTYADILSALDQPESDLGALSKRYQQARRQDYFHSPLGERVREALLSAGGRADG